MMFHEEWVLDGGRERILENNSVELYNLQTDLGERNNLCNTELKMRDELLNELLQWIEVTGAPIPAEPNPDFAK
jgi:hypothetical protein